MYRMLPQWLKATWIRHRQRHVRVRTWDDFTRAGDADVGSVAIVGNAGYLSDLEQGAEIDRHAVVIRLNNFRTAGFERHVGTRCDMFFTNFFTDIRYDRDEVRTARHVVASVPNAFAKRRRRHLHHRHAEHIVDGLTLLGRSDVCVPSAAEFAAACDTCRAVPSTGMMAIRFALRHLRFERLFITGYSFFRGGGHYFPGLRSSGKLHDFRRERRLLATMLVPLLDSGRVKADPLLDEDLRAAA